MVLFSGLFEKGGIMIRTRESGFSLLDVLGSIAVIALMLGFSCW